MLTYIFIFRFRKTLEWTNISFIRSHEDQIVLLSLFTYISSTEGCMKRIITSRFGYSGCANIRVYLSILTPSMYVTRDHLYCGHCHHCDHCYPIDVNVP